MRKINILTEDYIQLESALGAADNSVQSSLSDFRHQINDAIFEYEANSLSPESYVALRYSPVFEELMKYNCNIGLANFSKKLRNSNSIPLAEANAASYIFMLREGYSPKDEFDSASFCFGMDNSDIIRGENGVYNVSYTSAGRNIAMQHIARLQEAVSTAYRSLTSIDGDDIRKALLTLSEAYLISKGA